MNNQPNFETKLKQLNQIVEELSSNQLSLNESLQKFKAGMALSKQLQTELDDTQNTVAHLINPDDSKTDLHE